MLVEPISDIELEELIEWIEDRFPLDDRWETKALIKRLAFALKRARIGKGIY